MAPLAIVALHERTEAEKFSAEQCAILVTSARLSARLSEAELAKRCGIPESRIMQVEKGTVDIGIATLSLIVCACGFRLQVDLVKMEDHYVQVSVPLSPTPATS